MKKWIIALYLIGWLFISPLVTASALDVTITAMESSAVAEGLTHMTHTAQVRNDANVTSTQSINYLDLAPSSQIEMVTWSRTTSQGNWTMGTVEQIARHFETHNPGYTVVAGINGDYFAYSPTFHAINANVQFRGDIIKPENHEKYYSLGFNNQADTITRYKQLSYGAYVLSIFDPETLMPLRAIPLSGLNNNTLQEGQSTVFYNTATVNLNQAKAYLVGAPKTLIYRDLHLHGQGLIQTHHLTSFALPSQTFAIATRDASVIDLLDQNPYVRVQKQMIGEAGQWDNMIGIDSQVLDGGEVLSFTQIGGQSESVTQSRHPRTGLCVRDDGGVTLATVDGRQASGDAGIISQGVNLRELGQIFKQHGCQEGYNLDGGGSTQMITREGEHFRVVNSPSEGPHFPAGHNYHRNDYRAVANALLFVVPRVHVATTIETISSSQIVLTYEIKAAAGVTIDAMSLMINGDAQTLDHLSGTIEMNDLVESDWNVYGFVFDLNVNGQPFTQMTHSKMIDLSPSSGWREPIVPYGFEIHFEPLTDENAFEVQVSFSDPDRLLSRINVIRLDNAQKLTAFTRHAGLRVATIENVVWDREYNFQIEYFYDLNTQHVLLENIHSYTLTVHEEPETPNAILWPVIILGSTLGVVGGTLVIIRLKKGAKA